MKSNHSLLTVEYLLYAALAAAALWLRLYALDAHPLADAEARAALSVFRQVNGGASLLPASPAFFSFTYLSFLLFGASNATARLVPALLGAGLVLVPLLYRNAVGRGAALLASALLAGGATLTAAARTADGTMIAVMALAAGVGGLRRYQETQSRLWLVGAAVALGLGVASGAQFVTGVGALGLTVMVMAWTNAAERDTARIVWRTTAGQRGLIAVAGGAAALLAATLALVYPTGLAALAHSWLSWLTASLPSATARAPQWLLLFLVANEPLLLVWGLAGAVLAFRRGDRAPQWLFWFGLMALTLVLIRGGREVIDLTWVAAPLCGLAAWAISQTAAGVLDPDRESRPILAAHVAILLVLLGFGLMNTASFAEKARVDPLLTQEQVTYSGYVIPVSPVAYLAMSGVALALAALTTYLVAMGWEARTARQGLVLGVVTVLWAIGLRSMWGLTQTRAAAPAELWWQQPVSDDLNLLMRSAAAVSNYAVGSEHDVDVTVQAEADGALGWAFRNFPHVRFVDALDAVVTSSVVLAPADETNPTLGSAYVGQDFVLYQTWQPSLAWPEWVGWLAFRRARVDSQHFILWVRQDMAELQNAQ